MSCVCFTAYAQDGSEPYDPSKFIKIDINSGNPTYPYPQFLEYKGGGKSLAKYNAEGVTHADMEKAGREAYEIMMHRCRYEGKYCGVDYISFNRDDVPGNYGTFVSEGDGYAMLAAAIFADQKTFNGLYMWVHDIRFSGVKRFRDGKSRGETANDFAGPYLAAWKDKTFDAPYGSDSHSATDGDVDIAMAMLVAYKQWGEWLMQDGKVINDSEGNPISLKYEAQRVIGALVDTLGQWDKGSGALTGYLCGVVGIDGYEKRGNSWGELTRWRFSDAGNAAYPGFNGPYNGGPNLYGIYGGNYIDYDAPAYFEEFWRWLKNGDGTDKNNEKIAPWEIHQFKRAAASGNWLNKQAYDQGLYASIGRVDMETDGEPKFGVYVDGEDFRYPWRHMMDYLWHGNADYDWDPKTHQVIEGTNTSERDMGIRHAGLLKEPSKAGNVICTPMGASPDPGQPSWSGVSQIPQQWTPTGDLTSAYHTNYSVGAGSPAAVISEDLELLADVYRQCEIAWDGNNTAAKLNPEERYIGSTPKYFHGWFRTLGMLVCTGNLAAPEDMKPIANAKVYMSVDKTYAYQGDDVTYGVQYRNYGTLDAEGVKITTKLDPNYTFVSATKGGVYNSGSHSITWNVGSIPGFKTGKLDATMDSVFFTVNVADTLNPRICLTSTLTASNCDEWVSNEYPNHATYTMERNCVDILASRSLFIEKTSNRTALNPNDVVTFTVKFGNKSEGESSWLNGGRDNVRISYGTFKPDPCYQFYSLYRFWNDSYESYINMGNYRVSYFMYDAAAVGLVSDKNPTGWTFVVDNQNDLDKYGYNPPEGPITFAYQKIPQGSDDYGKWNQRLMIRFADVLMAPSTHVYDKLDSQYLLHKGVWGPGFIRARLASNPNQDLSNRVTDDWSYDPKVAEKTLDGQGTTFTLISPCWANYDDPGYVIDNYSRHVCKPTSVGNYERILVEEFDGYTWRRIQGTGPLPGKEAYNVTVVDTIPYELEWVGWADSTALKDDAGVKIQAKYTPCSDPKGKGYTGVVYWTVPEMLVGEEDKLVYRCKARDLGCPDVGDSYYKNVAWIWSDTDSPDSSQVNLMTTCSELPPQIEPQTSLFKRADKKYAEPGETVSYTVSFVNTLGTRVEADCKSTTGWKKMGSGSLPAVGPDGLKLSTNGSSAYFFGPEKSYGSDGAVYATIGGSPSSTQNLYIVFRYKGGTPGASDFKGVCMQLMINKDGKYNMGYYLYNDSKLIAKKGLSWEDAKQFSGDPDKPTFKFVLNGDHLYMYINDFEEEWTTVWEEWSGLTSTAPGYFGMYVNSNGNSNTQLTSFITELDYAFDVTLYDDLPAELGNIASISDNGVLKNNRITWPTVASTPETAIAPGDSVVRTFDAEVISCEKYINNLGLATVYGLDTLKVLNTIECGATECLLTSVLVTEDKAKICEGDSTVLRADVEGEGSFLYTYYLDGKKLAQSKYDTLVIKQSGNYHVVVSDPSNADCFVESDKVALKVIGKPESIELTVGTFCRNVSYSESAEYKKAQLVITGLKLIGLGFEWYDSEGNVLSGMPNPDDEEATGDYTYYYRTISNGCYSDSTKATFTIADTVTIDLKDVTICAGQEATITAPEDPSYTYLWSDNSTDASLTTSTAGVYGVKVTNPKGCVSRSSSTVTVADELVVDLGQDTTICSANLPLVLDATTSYDTYEWTDGSTESTLNVTESGEYEVKVTQGTCSGSGKISVTVSPSPELDGTFKATYLVSDTTSTGVFDKAITENDANTLKKEPGIQYVWYDKNEKKLSDEPIPAVPAEGNSEETYYVKAINEEGCESELKEIIVSVISSPMPSAEDVNYCVNDDSKPLEATATDNGSVTSWTLTWYDAENNKLAEAPKPSTDEAGKTVYYVSQTDPDGVEGAKKAVTVTVYALPELKPIMAFKRSCDEPILLNPLFEEQTGVEKFYVTFFDSDDEDMTSVNCIDCDEDVYATTSGTYRALASYRPVDGLRCVSEKSPIEITVDRIEDLKVEGSPTICPYDKVILTASATSKGSALEYEWSGAATSDEAEVSLTDRDGTYGKVYSFDLTVSAGVCEYDTTVKVTVGRGQLTGALFANGEQTKEYRSCGDEAIKLSTTHEGTDFVWTTYDGDVVGEGTSVEVSPETTTTYIVTFTNKCETSDTIEVHFFPFSVAAEFEKLDLSICEGESASGKLILNGYDPSMPGSYIKWFLDDKQLTEWDDKSEITLPSASTKDGGTYTFEASNGICVAKVEGDVTSAKLEVKPFVTYSYDQTVTVVRGEDVELSIAQVNPTNAVAAWVGDSHQGEGNPYTVPSVEADERFSLTVSADGYCDVEGSVQVLVDAKVVIEVATETEVICEGDEAILKADTTGTGKLLTPSAYKLNWYVCDESGDCQQLSATGLTLKHKPAANTSYYAEVVYGNQTVASEKVAVSVIAPLPYEVTTGAVSCSGEDVEVKVNVDASSDYEITWEDGTKGDVMRVAPEKNTTYSFTITQQGICPVTDQVEVAVKEKPSIEMDRETQICDGNGVDFNPTVSGDDILSYKWTDPNGLLVASTKKLSVESPESGNYTLTVVTESCGEATASQEVKKIPLPELMVDSIGINSRLISASGQSAQYEYRVDNGTWSTQDVYENLMYDILHTAYARDDNGCVGSLAFVVPSPPIFIPEYFTPGSDGKNDTWDLTTILDAYPNSQVTIYDRYGKVVAKMDGDNEEWDGTYNGNPLPSTDYWYQIYVPEIRKNFTGHFTLIRSK